MSAFDAGRIVATADLDRSPFQRGLQEAKREARDFADGKYSAKLGADTKDGDAKVYDFKTRLERLGASTVSPKVALENGAGLRALIDFNDRLDKLRAKVATAKADVDDERAKAKLDALELQLRRVGLINSRARVSVEGVERANLQLDALGLKLAAVSHAGGGGGGRSLAGGSGGGFFSRLPKGPGLLGLGIGAALPMAGPLAGVGLGAGASFLAPTVAGGLGLGAFAAGAKSSFTAVGNHLKKQTAQQQRYNAATTDKQRAAVLRKEHELWASLDPAQRRAVKNVDSLEASWKRYQKALEPQSFGVLAEGAQIAEKGLRLLLPTAKAVGNEVENLASRANAALSQPFWRRFFHGFLAVEAPIAVNILGTSLGNVVTGIAHLAERFAPLGHDLENMLSNTSSGFEKWTTGSGPAKFVAFVEKEGPIVARDLHGLGKALEGLGKGLSPIGQVELKALGPVLEFIGKVGNEHPGVITAVGTALLGVGAGLKVIAGVRGIQGILGGIHGLGRGGGGGLPGGILGKGAPVPVYVTNWHEGGGGLPGGGGPKGETAGGVAKTGILTRLGLAGVTRLAGPLALTYAATAGGDTAHVPAVQNSNAGALGQLLLPILRAIAATGRAGTANNRSSPGAVAYDKIFSGRIDDPHGQKVDVGQAVGFIKAYGGPQAIAQLDQLAKKYPQVAAGVKEYNGQVSGLNRLLGINARQSVSVKGATSNFDDVLTHIPGTMRRATAATDGFSGSLHRAGGNAQAAGDQIGTDLGRGLTIALDRELHAATVTAKLQVAQLIKHIRFDHNGVNAGSPSKNMMPAGKDMADGLLVGWIRRLREARGEFAGGALSTIHGLETAAARYVAGTQGRLDSARSTLSADRSARSGYIANLTSSYTGFANISGALNPNGSVGSVRGFLRSRLGKLRQFVDILHKLARRHLSPTLLQEVADQGPDGGIGLGQSILAAGGIGDLNRLQRQIDSYARQGASFAGHAVYDPRIAADEKHVRELVHEVKLQRQELHDVLVAIRHNPAAFAHALADEFRNAQHRATAGGH